MFSLSARHSTWCHSLPSQSGCLTVSRAHGILPGQLETDNFTPLDLACGVRIPLGNDRTTTTSQAYKAIAVHKRFGQTGYGGSSQAGGEVSDQAGRTNSGPVYQPDLLGSKEGQISTPSGKPETTEPLDCEEKVQDGRSEGCGPEGWELKGIHLSGLSTPSSRPSVSGLEPEIPPVCVERGDLRVPVPSIWAKQCSQGIYKTTEASHGPPQEMRDPESDIPGRYAANGRVEGGAGTENTGDPDLTEIAGIQDQLGEKSADTVVCDNLSRDDCRLHTAGHSQHHSHSRP